MSWETYGIVSRFMVGGRGRGVDAEGSSVSAFGTFESEIQLDENVWGRGIESTTICIYIVESYSIYSSILTRSGNEICGRCTRWCDDTRYTRSASFLRRSNAAEHSPYEHNACAESHLPIASTRIAFTVLHFSIFRVRTWYSGVVVAAVSLSLKSVWRKKPY